MPASLRLEPREGILHAVVTGELTMAEAMAFSERIFEACLAEGWTRVLVDIRAQHMLPDAMSIYEHAAHTAALNKEFLQRGMKPIRLAYLGTEDNITFDHFGETVHVNRGMDVKSTTSLEEALDWLAAKG